MPSKISLCLIVGNVEEYIERCLESFKPIADEICVVRAIGNAAPDKTLDICREKFGAITAEYKNADGHDWPHVDDFAAARQMSFDIATGDYCFWCDSDDILKSGADRIRKHANEGGYACYIFPYDVFGKNVIVPRERMIRRGSGRWESPVHESFQFAVKGTQAIQDDSVIVQHLPHVSKSGSNERNLTILESIPKDKLTPSLKYHLVGELNGAGRDAESVQLAVELVQGTELGKDERYDLLMSLVVKSTDLASRVNLLHEAHKVDPQRREALGILATTMMDLGKPPEAMAYARQMAATTPQTHCWNSRQSFYSYVGDDIYQQALRVNGKFAEAEVVRSAALQKAGGARIALLHATRGRPEMASKCRKWWHDLAEKPEQIEHIFAIDDDDKDSQVLRRFHHVMSSGGGGCVRAWNMAAVSTGAPVLIQLSDDWVPVPMWDKLILERIGDVAKPSVLAVSDGVRTDNLLCMAICTRAYAAQDHFLFHPGFKGVYSDNWFTDLAYSRGQVIEARDIVFKHNHPAFNPETKVDKTYEVQNSPERYAEGKALYDWLKTGKDWSSAPGFFNYWEYYEAIATWLPDGACIAEVGTWLGRSIIYLCQALKRKGKNKCIVYAVDCFKGELNQPAHVETVQAHGGSILGAFKENIKRCGVDDMIHIIDGDSAESAKKFADKSLDFVYIDAAHDYQSVKRDIQAWNPKVKTTGIIGGHDAQWHEVKKAVEEEVPNAQQFGCVWSTNIKTA